MCCRHPFTVDVICCVGPVTARRHACWPGVRCCIKHEYCAVQRELVLTVSVTSVTIPVCALPVRRSMPSTSHLIRDHQVCAVSYLLSVICNSISVNALLAVNPVTDSIWPALYGVCVLHLDLHHSIAMWLVIHLISPANTVLGLLIVVGIQGDAMIADPLCSKTTWGHLDIKMASYQYGNTHYKDKTVWRPSYLCNGNPYLWKWGLRIETVLWFFTQRNQLCG